MVRVVAVVEGPTEQAFIQRVLAPHLSTRDVQISGRIIGEPGHKGGNIKLERVARDVSILLRQETVTFVTTLIDRYGLGAGWPVIDPAGPDAMPERSLMLLCEAMRNKIREQIGAELLATRFLPYVQFHETEAFLFVEPAVSARLMGNEARSRQLLKESESFATPEHINNDKTSAPSKRIQKHFPAYQKGRGLNAHLPMICEAVGISDIRQACPLFDGWLLQLESLSA